MTFWLILVLVLGVFWGYAALAFGGASMSDAPQAADEALGNARVAFWAGTLVALAMLVVHFMPF